MRAVPRHCRFAKLEGIAHSVALSQTIPASAKAKVRPNPFFHHVPKLKYRSVELLLASAFVRHIRKNVPNRDGKALGYADGFAGIFETYRVFRSRFVIRGLLEMIGGREIACEAAVDSWVFFGKLMELIFHTPVRFRNPICSLEY